MNKALIEARRKFEGWKPKVHTFEPELLLHPNIPKPLHTVNPRTVMGQVWWDKVRRVAYKEKDYHCHACGVHKTNAKMPWLECHEVYKINYKTGRVVLKRLVALCPYCHSYIHSGFLEVRLDRGDIDDRTYNDIIKHGDSVLKKGGIKKSKMEPPRHVAEWTKWHMVIDGKKYYSPFKTYDQWEKHWAKEESVLHADIY